MNEQDLRSQLSRELATEKILEVAELTTGLFNSTYRVATTTKAYILKVAPESGADVFYNERYLMQRERSISRQLQSISPLIPDYLSFFSVGGREAFLQPLIPGRLWQQEIPYLSAVENASLWKQLGQFCRKVHACRGDSFGYPPPFEGFSYWSEFIADNVNGMVDDCRRLDVLCEEIETYCDYLPRFCSMLDQVGPARLSHGDLWPRNVIIDGSGKDIHIKAVFDAERTFWGDPLSDWVLILYDLPGSFWQGYGRNLLEISEPARIAVYKGMYFILNILESVRFHQSDETPRKNLAAVNRELGDL